MTKLVEIKKVKCCDSNKLSYYIERLTWGDISSLQIQDDRNNSGLFVVTYTYYIQDRRKNDRRKQNVD